ncbi:MAG: hypothetical protein HQM11_13105 [SAR324 cluster bacterium]|nr:hypothetical protein [SAR324 cluster bacterium]
MKMFKKIIIIAVSALMINVTITSQSYAAGMKLVFVDALYGGALGAVVGASVWALANDRNNDNDDKNMALEAYIIKGTALGVLGGMAYGFYENESKGGGAFGDSQNSRPQNLVTWDTSKDLIVISPVHGLPVFKTGETAWTSSLLGIRF